MKCAPQAKFGLVLITLCGSWFAFSGCGIDEQSDLKSQHCDHDCVNVRGRFISSEGSNPIADVSVKVQWEDLGMHGGVIRSKAQQQTNGAGNFDISFTQREDEVANGSYQVLYTVNENLFYIDKSNNAISLGGTEKDSAYHFEFQIPRLAYAVVKVKNLEDMKTGDSFYIQFSTPYGLNGEQQLTSGTSAMDATPRKRIFIGADVPVTVQLSKIKNGITTFENQIISAAPGQVKNLEVAF